jgi:ribosomal protein S27E
MEIFCPKCKNKQIWVVIECEDCGEPIDITEIISKVK